MSSTRKRLAEEEQDDCPATKRTKKPFDAAAYKEMAAAWRDKAAAAERRAASLKEFLRRGLAAAGKDKVKGRWFSARAAVAPRPSIAWAYEGGEPIPEAFARTRVSLDGAKAFEAYKAEDLPEGFRVAWSEYLDLR